jgi:hypothetical protein
LWLASRNHLPPAAARYAFHGSQSCRQ